MTWSCCKGHLSGHGLDASNQVVLGATTMPEFHAHLGDTVTVSSGGRKPIHLTIVGTATMPAIGTQSEHLEMGTGALLEYNLIPAAARNLQQSTIPGPNAFLIRVRPGANPTLVGRSFRRIDAKLNASPDSSGGVVGVLRPAEIANYRSTGTVPSLLGGALAVGAVVALGLTLVASVRRRRRDLALLKTLGFTQRQLAATVAWQSTIAVALGVVVGIPLGIVAGRTPGTCSHGTSTPCPRQVFPFSTSCSSPSVRSFSPMRARRSRGGSPRGRRPR